MNLYAPNVANHEVRFFKELENQLEDFSQENIFIADDFNCARLKMTKKVETQFGKNPQWLKKSSILRTIII